MNHYGVTAKRHWERWLPARYAAIQDPDSFFSTLGEEVAYRIADLTLDLTGDDPPEEDYLVKVGRLNMARLQAEEIVLREQVLLPPEPEAACFTCAPSSTAKTSKARGSKSQINRGFTESSFAEIGF